MSEIKLRLRSNYLDGSVDVQVILPNPFLAHDPKRFYENGKKYPVMWLLHGGKDSYTDWIMYSSIDRESILRNCIIVAPVAPNSSFMDQPLVWEGYNFYSYFFGELMPFIHNWLPASSAPEDNYLAGFSMGCEATWRYGIANPDKFGAIAPLGDVPGDYTWLEAYRALTGAEFRKKFSDRNVDGRQLSQLMLNDITKFATVGAFLDSKENTMARLKEALAGGSLPKTYFACGKDDPEAAGFARFVKESGTDRICIADKYEAPAKGIAFAEKAAYDFFDFVGLKNISCEQGEVPYGVGVNFDLTDDSRGVTIH